MPSLQEEPGEKCQNHFQIVTFFYYNSALQLTEIPLSNLFRQPVLFSKYLTVAYTMPLLMAAVDGFLMPDFDG